ncbi:SDR family NAD(P)-dependent oxidoreductase, partial [Thalassobaculum sp.]|uniref:SDR family NAD(P)-dependent oxidoreductase n=1 Tax=Thalassobaculum sp. TaxID=2022740 RepID=UPI0032EB7A24
MAGQQRVALITGGGGGIGGAMCAAVAAGGAKVAVVDRDEAAARRVADGIGGSAVAIAADVSSEDGCAAATAAVENALGPVDSFGHTRVDCARSGQPIGEAAS